MSDRNNDLSRRDALCLIGSGIATLLAGNSAVGSDTLYASANAPGIRALQRSVSGEVIARGADDFEAVRNSLIWNQLVPDRSPDLIVRAGSTADVATAVRHARDHGLRVSLRGSGHNYHAAPLRKGGLLLDAGGMTDIEVDAGARRASVGPGVLGGQLVAALEPHGLAFPVGHCPDVGLSGFLLGGGIGWNFGAWGPACMSVRGVELVTAAGEVLYADATRHQDLYWAARGAGRGFFAAATRFDLALHERPRAIRSLTLNFDLQSLQLVCNWFEQAIITVDPTVEVVFALIAPESGGQPFLLIAAFAMAESAEAASSYFGSLRQPPADARLIGNIEEQAATFDDLFKEAGFPVGARMHGDTRYSNAPLPMLMEKMRPFVESRAQAPSMAMCVYLGQKSLIPQLGSSAFSVYGRAYIGVYAFWEQPSEDAQQRDGVRATIRALEPLTVGAYISEVDLDSGPQIAKRCYSPAAWRRLTALKQQHDPGNLFYGYT